MGFPLFTGISGMLDMEREPSFGVYFLDSAVRSSSTACSQQHCLQMRPGLQHVGLRFACGISALHMSQRAASSSPLPLPERVPLVVSRYLAVFAKAWCGSATS